jgi:hypothetical protein
MPHNIKSGQECSSCSHDTANFTLHPAANLKTKKEKKKWKREGERKEKKRREKEKGFNFYIADLKFPITGFPGPCTRAMARTTNDYYQCQKSFP